MSSPCACRCSKRGMVDDTVLRIPLRPLAPRQRVDLPLRLRWSVSGALRGLGATLVDAAAPAVDGPPATSILEARVVEVDDDGPPLPDPELDDPDDEPVPPPMPILPIRPRTEVSR